MPTKSSLVPPTQNHIAQAGNPPMGTVTSSYFVSIGDLLTSNLTAPLNTAVPLLWFTSIEERVSMGNMASDNQASATLIHSLLELHIQTDSFMPVLRQALRNNDNVARIELTRVGHLGDGKENTALYASGFQNCKIESIEEFPDKLILKVRVSARSDTAAVTDFTNTQTTPSGQTESGWDYSTNEPIAAA